MYTLVLKQWTYRKAQVGRHKYDSWVFMGCTLQWNDVLFQPQVRHVLCAVMARALSHLAVGPTCLVIIAVHWVKRRWTQRGSNHPETSTWVLLRNLCLEVLRTGSQDTTPGRSTSRPVDSTSDSVWPASTHWLLHTTFVSSSLMTCVICCVFSKHSRISNCSLWIAMIRCS